MKVYAYDENTKEFLREITAMVDPLESKLKKEMIFLIPANCTEIPPPSVETGSVACFENNNWTVKDDTRGETFNDEMGRPFTVRELGISKPPVVSENETACLKDGIWVVKRDYRGHQYYLKSTGEPYTIKELDMEPDELITEIKPPDNISSWDIDLNGWVKDLKKEKEENKKDIESQLKNRESKLLLILEDLLEIPSIKEQLSEESVIILNERKTLRDQLK